MKTTNHVSSQKSFIAICLLVTSLLVNQKGIAQGVLNTIDVHPLNMTMEKGTTQAFLVIGKDPQGNTVPLGNPQIQGTGGTMAVTINPDGTTTVEYTAGQQTGNFYFEIWDADVTYPPGSPDTIWGSADITIVNEQSSELSSILVFPLDVTLGIDQSQVFIATGSDQNSNPYNITNPVWIPTSGGGTTNPNGTSCTFTTTGPEGTYTVTFRQEGTTIEGSATIHVTQTPELSDIDVSPSEVMLGADESQVFTVTAKDGQGSTIPFVTLDVVVDHCGGSITDIQPGEAEHTKEVTYQAGNTAGDGYYLEFYDSGVTGAPGSPGAIWGSADITITPVQAPELSDIDVSPSEVTLGAGESQVFTATGTDQHGDPYTITNPIWTNTGGGTFTPDGTSCTYTAGDTPEDDIITCKQAGTTIEGSSTAHIVTISPVLSDIDVSPSDVTLTGGDSQVFTAAGTNQYGYPHAIPDPVWTTTGGGTLSESGSHKKAIQIDNSTIVYTATENGVYIVVCTDSASGIADTANVHIISTGVVSENSLPDDFKLFQNYPNPFNCSTTIAYSIPGDAEVKLFIYDLNGKRVKILVDSYTKSGYYKITWNGLDDNRCEVSSGIYIVKLQTSIYSKTQKIMLIK